MPQEQGRQEHRSAAPEQLPGPYRRAGPPAAQRRRPPNSRERQGVLAGGERVRPRRSSRSGRRPGPTGPYPPPSCRPLAVSSDTTTPPPHLSVSGRRRKTRSESCLLLVATLNAGALEKLTVLLLRHPLAPLLDDRAHDYPRSLRFSPPPRLGERGPRCGASEPTRPTSDQTTCQRVMGVIRGAIGRLSEPRIHPGMPRCVQPTVAGRRRSDQEGRPDTDHSPTGGRQARRGSDVAVTLPPGVSRGAPDCSGRLHPHVRDPQVLVDGLLRDPE